jgi:hypothetical protein
MVVSGPSVIVNPAAASGLTVRRPRVQVFIDGEPLPFVLELTITRGLDQDLATAEITYPHPLPDFVRQWSEVRILAGAGTHYLERFVGYVVGVDMSLWPGAKLIRCQDVLAIAANRFSPEEVDLHDMTDQFAVREVLFGCGYRETLFSGIVGTTPGSGTGVLLADVQEAQLWWELGSSGLEAIQQIDSISLGWRTYATAGGRIVRTLIDTDPNKVQTVHDFGEGVDIIDGSATMEILDPRNEITVTGFDGSVTVTLDPEDDPFHFSRNAYWIRFMALRTQAISSGVINPQDVALYILSQIGKPLISVTFSTHLDIPFVGQEVIGLTSEQLEVDQNFWVQSVQLSITPDGAFTQTITGISALQPQNRHLVVPPVDVDDVPGVDPGGDIPGAELPTPDPVGDADILVDFTMIAVDSELAAPAELPADLGSTYYIIAASDTSTSRTGTIATRAWTAGGAGARVTSGEGETFTTAFTSLEGATITLTVTDSNGSTGTLTLPVDPSTNPARSRMLFAFTETTYEAYDGTEWRAFTPTGHGTVTSIGGGAYWGTSDGWFAYSADGLATAPTEYDVTTNGALTAMWVHETQVGHVVVGTAAGTLYVTPDHGVTWGGPGGGSVGGGKFGPDGGNPDGSVPIRHVISSIHDANQWHVLTPTGWHMSPDAGSTWSLVRAGDFVYLELSHTRNILIDSAGLLQKAEDGTPFTGNTSPIAAATAMIRADGFYAIAEDGTTWYTDAEGSYALVAGEPIPAGSVQTGGAYRDGLVPEMVFFAAQDGGIFKTTDGFKTAEGYLRLRDPSRLTP